MNVLRAHDYTTTGPPRLVDITELSRLLSIPQASLYNLVHQQRIPFVKCGRSLRFDPFDVVQSLPHFPDGRG
jgi:excisionase family DNA binding protein